MDKVIIFVVLLQLLGSVFLIAEFLLPSAGLLTLVSSFSFITSLYLIYRNFETIWLVSAVLGEFVLIPVLIFIGVNLVVNSKATLKSSLESKVKIDLDLSVGDEGVAITRIAPSGKIEVNSKRYDVISRGDYISKGDSVRVFEIVGSKIKVEKIITNQ